MRQLVSWSPWSDFERMLNTVDSMRTSRENQSSGIFIPMDIYEQDNKIMVRCSVPGVKPEDLSLTIDQGMLTLSGESKNEYEKKEGNRVYHREHSYGRFTRSVKLPDDADENGVDATFEHGVLTVSIARAIQPQPTPKQIAIKGVGQAIQGKPESLPSESEKNGADRAAAREKVGSNN